jgi:transglutaminase/protease-like cytokinesis protein 3
MKPRILFLISLIICSASLRTSNGRSLKKRKNKSRPIVRKKLAKNHIVDFDLTFDLAVPGETDRINLTLVLPKTIPERQKILDTHYSPKPSRVFNKNGNRYAEFVFNKPRKRINIDINIKAELYRYDLETAKLSSSLAERRKKSNSENNPDKSGLTDFLKHEKYIEKSHTDIRNIAGDIEGRTEEEIVKKIYDHVIDNMKYIKHGSREWGAVMALHKGKGDCSEYSDLFVALCRAKNIPARIVTGYFIQPDLTSIKHNWAEAYMNDYGWVPFETSINRDLPRRNAFRKMWPVYIYFSNIRNDEVLQNYHFASFKYHGDKVSLKDSIKIKNSSYFPPKESH